MIDRVKNPWRRKKGVIVFDIETAPLTGWNESDKRKARFRCGVAFVYDRKCYLEFTKPKELVRLLKGAKSLVSYNGEGFDFLVLEKHGLRIRKFKDRWRPQSIESFDIMHTIQALRPHKHRGKKYPKLEEMMEQHYGTSKSRYSPEDMKHLLRHCREDVENTVKLYEEEVWEVPVLSRTSAKRCWEHCYDDDISGVVYDGESLTQINDFGIPIKRYLNAEATMLCPKCKAKKLPLRLVAQGRENRVECPRCGAVVTFSADNEIAGVQSKRAFKLSVCKNCGKRLESAGYNHYGYGAGMGYLSSGRTKCPACGNGCYEWENDDTPGFREHWIGSCCKCKRDISKWLSR